MFLLIENDHKSSSGREGNIISMRDVILLPISHPQRERKVPLNGCFDLRAIQNEFRSQSEIRR